MALVNVPMQQLRRTETAAASDTLVPDDGQLVLVYMDDGTVRQFVGDDSATIADLFGTAYYWPMLPELSSGYLVAANNLSDVADVDTARGNLAAAPLASPAFTGTPTAPTASSADSSTKLATTAFVQTLIANLINSAPGALDTLGELATQMAADESAVSALTTTVSGKLAKASNLSDLTDAAAARGNLGGTDIGKALFTVSTPAGVRFIRLNSDGSITLLTAAELLSDIGAQGSGLALLAANNLSDLANASTARTNLGVRIGVDVNAYSAVLNTIDGLSYHNDDVLQVKSGAWTNRTLAQLLTDLVTAGAAPLASPAFTGTPTAPTASSADSSTKLATTAFVQTLIANLINSAPGALDTLGELAAQMAADESAVSALTTTVAGKLAKASNLSDLTDAAAARTNLGLAIGTNVQAHDADLDAIAALSPSNDDVLQRKSGAWTNRTIAQLKTDLAYGTAAAADTGTGAANVPTITQADARYAPKPKTVQVNGFTFNSASYTDLTGASVSLDANTTYEVDIKVTWNAPTSATGIGVSVTMTNSPAPRSLNRFQPVASTGTVAAQIAADDAGSIATGSNGTSSLVCTLSGIVKTGGSASTLQLRVARGGTSATVTVDSAIIMARPLP